MKIIDASKPRTMLVGNKAHHQPNYEVQGFTAKETAEIARSYAQAVENQRHDPCSATSELCDRWRDLFKEWSK